MLTFSVRVIDEHNKLGVSAAHVYVEVNQERKESQLTDSNGYVSVNVPKSATSFVIRVEAPGYKPEFKIESHKRTGTLLFDIEKQDKGNQSSAEMSPTVSLKTPFQSGTPINPNQSGKGGAGHTSQTKQSEGTTGVQIGTSSEGKDRDELVNAIKEYNVKYGKLNLRSRENHCDEYYAALS